MVRMDVTDLHVCHALGVVVLLTVLSFVLGFRSFKNTISNRSQQYLHFLRVLLQSSHLLIISFLELGFQVVGH